MNLDQQASRSTLRIAVVTHARKEQFFCAMWSAHYGKIFGHENLFLYKDGEDWELPTSARFGNVIPTAFPKSRRKCDEHVTHFLSQECSNLLNQYDVVLRTDVDEFLVVDPLAGCWADVWSEATENGYIFAVGLDVVQNEDVEGAIDLGRPILAQRKFAYIRGDFCKPCVITRPVRWLSAFAIDGAPVILSKCLKLIHLASMDRVLQEERLADRGDFTKVSYAGHAKSRLRRFEVVKSEKVYELDSVADLVNRRLSSDDDGQRALSPRFAKIETPDGIVRKKALCVRLPIRFENLINSP